MSIPQINNVGVRDVNIFRIPVPQIYSTPSATPTVPFILNIGSPVVNMPGCVKYHPDAADNRDCLLYTSPSPRDKRQSRMPSSA